MLRSYRHIVLAVVGWLILCGAHQPQKHADSAHGAQQSAPAPSAATASAPAPTASPIAPFTAYGGYDPDPCYHAKDPNAGNLCACWRAAIAAEKSAHEARRATNWAIFATFLSFAGLCGIIWSLTQTQGALEETRRGNRNALLFEKRARRESREASANTKAAIAQAERNADAAAKHVKVAQSIAERQLRAYITHETFDIVTRINPDSGFLDSFEIRAVIRNTGQTPATLIDGFINVRAAEWGEPIDRDVIKFGIVAPINTVIGAGNVSKAGFQTFPRDALIEFNEGLIDIRLYIGIQYRDVFNKVRETKALMRMFPLIAVEEFENAGGDWTTLQYADIVRFDTVHDFGSFT